MSAAPVPFLDLAAQNAPLRAAIRAAMDRVVESNHFINGPEVTAFEREIAAAIGVDHAIGVSSGTDALVVSLMALGIGHGDEVITTPFTFFATAGSIARVGARPVFVDIEPLTMNIDPAGIERAVTERTRAILPVHLFGQPADMAKIREIAARHHVPIIEDAAQAIGATHPDGAVGGLGALGCFSFFPSKNLGAFGDGGLVTTNDGELAERVRVLSAHGAKPKYFHQLVGGNFRLDALQAAILRVKLPHLATWTEARRKNAARYDHAFAESELPRERLTTPTRVFDGHIYNQYVIRTDRRDALVRHLDASKIGNVIYYPRALHQQACFADLGFGTGDFPEAERAVDEVLALPIYAELGPEAQGRVIEAIKTFLGAAD
jgi:dTDP-4-amino-4,6-dideoxygalactose transaminase